MQKICYATADVYRSQGNDFLGNWWSVAQWNGEYDYLWFKWGGLIAFGADWTGITGKINWIQVRGWARSHSHTTYPQLAVGLFDFYNWFALEALHSLSTSDYTEYVYTLYTNPFTGNPFQVSELPNWSLGLQVNNPPGSTSGDCHWLYAIVDYTPLAAGGAQIIGLPW